MPVTTTRAAILSAAIASLFAASASAQSLSLRYGSFDPVVATPDIPAHLRSTAEQRLWLVQFASTPTQAGRDAIHVAGGQVIKYMPSHAYVVRMDRPAMEVVAQLAAVRWVGSYHPAYRIDPELLGAKRFGGDAATRYNVVVADKHADKPLLAEKVRQLGGTVHSEHVGSILMTVDLTGPQLQQFLAFDEVLWVDLWSAPELDMDNARIQGGGNYVESQGGYTGQGVNAHIYEGIEASHPDFTGGATAVRSTASAQTHGHATGGIVFGNGTSNPAVRGMAPDAGKFYTNYNTVSTSRWQVFSDLVNIHEVSHTTASWGDARTFFYTSVSADSDDAVFDHDIPWTQSQSNAGNQDSRPQAWAKNVFSIGGVNHQDDSNPNNDSWQNGGASIGPASDGRIKPTLCAYYDNIGTSDRTGSAGYSSGNWTSGFGGTSGATPIVAGHNVLAIEMFTEEVSSGVGLFGNPLRVPGGTTHQNRPHFPTLKALMVVNATQYAFTGGSSDNRREHQGWGFPDVQTMYDNRLKTYIVDETDVLVQGQTQRHDIVVGAGEPSLKICLNWSEPAANPSSTFHLINDLSLRVTAPNGTTYWGNHNLENGVWSTPGGSEDGVNSLECCFIQNPQAGTWFVDVLATSIVEDNHVETGAVDADYGLCVVGGNGTLGGSNGTFATTTPVGVGCGGTAIVCDDAFYEFGNSTDLGNSSFSLVYSASEDSYTLVPGFGTWIGGGSALPLGDDDDSTENLGFTLSFPGGSTSSLRVCSNGFLENGGSSTAYDPAISAFLAGQSWWSPMWHDFDPTSAGQVLFQTNGTRAVFTWDAVEYWGSTETATFQIQFWNDGNVHFLYQQVDAGGNDYLIGYSLASAADPGGVDISASLNAGIQVCNGAAGTADLALAASGRPVLGANLALNTSNVPLTAVAGLMILSAVPIPGGVSMASLGVPDCFVYQNLDVTVTIGVAGGSGTFLFAVPSDPALVDQHVYAQSAAFDFGINAFNTITSNGLDLKLGDL